MSWFEIADVFILYTAIGSLAVLYAILSKLLKHILNISEIVVALCVGGLLGTFPGNVYTVLAPGTWFVGVSDVRFIEEITRIGISVQLMATGLRVGRRAIFRVWRPLLILLVIVMSLSWLTAGLLAWAILEGFSFWEAMLVGSFAAPTDPVVAASIVEGKFASRKVSKDLRALVSAESGVNDGLAYPFVFLSIMLIVHPTGKAMQEFFLRVLLYDVVFAAAFGAVAGTLAGFALRWSHKARLIDKTSLLGFTLMLTFAVMGIVRIFAADEILAVFTCGLALAKVLSLEDRHREEKVQETIDAILSTTLFFFVGLVIPWTDWEQLGWRGLLLTFLVLLFKRLPWVILFYPCMRPRVANLPEAAFLGWFGPMGAAALYYASIAETRTKNHSAQSELLFGIATQFTVLSVLLYGATAAPFGYCLRWLHNPYHKAKHTEAETKERERKKRKKRRKEAEAEEKHPQGIEILEDTLEPKVGAYDALSDWLANKMAHV